MKVDYCRPVVHTDGHLELKIVAAKKPPYWDAISAVVSTLVYPIFVVCGMVGASIAAVEWIHDKIREGRIHQKLTHLNSETAPLLIAKRLSKLERRIQSLTGKLIGHPLDEGSIQQALQEYGKSYEEVISLYRDEGHSEKYEKMKAKAAPALELYDLYSSYFRACEEKQRLESASPDEAEELLRQKYQYSLVKNQIYCRGEVHKMRSLLWLIPVVGILIGERTAYSIKNTLEAQGLAESYEAKRKYSWLSPLKTKSLF